MPILNIDWEELITDWINSSFFRSVSALSESDTSTRRITSFSLLGRSYSKVMPERTDTLKTIMIKCSTIETIRFLVRRYFFATRKYGIIVRTTAGINSRRNHGLEKFILKFVIVSAGAESVTGSTSGTTSPTTATSGFPSRTSRFSVRTYGSL